MSIGCFNEKNIEVDCIIGVSVGVLFGANYFSKQQEIALRYNKQYLIDKGYISKRSLLLTGNLVNKDFAYYKITKEFDPFDNETFIKVNKEYYVIVTNVKNGEPEYLKCTRTIRRVLDNISNAFLF